MLEGLVGWSGFQQQTIQRIQEQTKALFDLSPNILQSENSPGPVMKLISVSPANSPSPWSGWANSKARPAFCTASANLKKATCLELKGEGTGCDRSWLQFIGIWRKYGLNVAEIWHSISNKKLQVVHLRHLPASQCHAAREVQRGPYMWVKKTQQSRAKSWEICLWKHGYNATNTSTNFVDSLLPTLGMMKKDFESIIRFSAQSTTWE